MVVIFVVVIFCVFVFSSCLESPVFRNFTVSFGDCFSLPNVLGPLNLQTQILKFCETSLIFFFSPLCWPSWSDPLIFITFILYFSSLCPFALISGRFSQIYLLSLLLSYKFPSTRIFSLFQELYFVASRCYSSFVNAVSFNFRL